MSSKKRLHAYNNHNADDENQSHNNTITNATNSSSSSSNNDNKSNSTSDAQYVLLPANAVVSQKRGWLVVVSLLANTLLLSAVGCALYLLPQATMALYQSNSQQAMNELAVQQTRTLAAALFTLAAINFVMLGVRDAEACATVCYAMAYGYLFSIATHAMYLYAESGSFFLGLQQQPYDITLLLWSRYYVPILFAIFNILAAWIDDAVEVVTLTDLQARNLLLSPAISSSTSQQINNIKNNNNNNKSNSLAVEQSSSIPKLSMSSVSSSSSPSRSDAAAAATTSNSPASKAKPTQQSSPKTSPKATSPTKKKQ